MELERQRARWRGPAPLVRQRWQRFAWGLLLAGLGALLNTRELPVWLDIQIDPSLWTASAFLLGSLPAILALLFLGGWWGVGVAASAWSVSWAVWGHPWGLVAMSGQFVWLTIALAQRDGRDLLGTGRVILSALAYWLLIGSPSTLLYQRYVNQFSWWNAGVIAVKYPVNETIVLALGCMIYFVLRLANGRRSSVGLSVRGVVLMMVLSSISITGLAFTLFSLDKLEESVQLGLEQRLVLTRDAIAAYTPADLDSWGAEDQRTIGDAAFYRRDNDGQSWTSDQQLLTLLRTNYSRLSTRLLDGAGNGLYVLAPRGERVRNRRWEKAYFVFDYPANSSKDLKDLPYFEPIQTLKVAVPARPLIDQVQGFGMSMLLLLASMVAVAVVVSDFAAARFSREFELVLVPVEDSGSGPTAKDAQRSVGDDQNPALGLRPLNSSPIHELDVMVDALNGRIRQVNQLTADLRVTNQELEQSRAHIENLLAISDRQMQTAKQIQQYFLAEAPPPSAGYELAYFLQPAYQVGADWYDLLTVDGKQFMVVADVCDKGVGSALFMSVFRSLLRYSLIGEFSASTDCSEAVPLGDRLARVALVVNRYMAENHGASSMFATVFLAAYEPDTHCLDYVCAGHEAPLLRCSGGVETLDVTGPALGIFAGAQFSSRRCQLAPGDVLVAFTDGLSDARGAEETPLGQPAVKALLADASSDSRSAQAWLDALKQLALDHMGEAEQFDDLTLMVLKVVA